MHALSAADTPKILRIEGEDCVQAVAGGEMDEGGVGELDSDVAILFQDGGDGLGVGGGGRSSRNPVSRLLSRRRKPRLRS